MPENESTLSEVFAVLKPGLSVDAVPGALHSARTYEETRRLFITPGEGTGNPVET